MELGILCNFSVSLLIGLEMGHSRSTEEFFFQVYTLHGLVQDRVIPYIYALLPHKSEDTYHRFFEEVSNTLDLKHSPQDIMTDFEIAAINVANATFEGTEMKDYFFHLCSNLWKRIQRGELKQRYIDDPEFVNTLLLIAALAFAPHDEVDAYFEQYCDHARNLYDSDCDLIIDYFEDVYIGRLRKRTSKGTPFCTATMEHVS